MTRPAQIVVVGAGFGGYHAVRRLERLLSPAQAEITVISPTDHLLYTPLLPEVAGALLDPRDIAVPLTGTLRSRLLLGRATRIDVPARTVTVTSPDGADRTIRWDRLVIAAGSTARLAPVPGLAEHAVGFKTTTEATHLRDRVLARLEQAATCRDPLTRAELSTFVVIGAGFAGTELTAFLQRLCAAYTRRQPAGYALTPRWVLVDAAPRVLPELDERLGARALAVLSRRGVDVRLSRTVRAVSARSVTLDDGAELATRTVIWCAGTAPNPLAATLGVPLDRDRIPVDAHLAVPGLPGVFALGDLAAVPDLTAPGRQTAPTAQHATRQGHAVARNVAASLGLGQARPYRHRDLGLAADLGGGQGVARPLGIKVEGLAARAAARGYHLWALPANRPRVLASWLLAAGRDPLLVHLDLAGADGAVLRAQLASSRPGAAAAPLPDARRTLEPSVR